MNATEPSTTEHKAEQKPVWRDYLGGWRLWLVVGIIVIIAGVALNWNWLVAAGLAPLLLVVLPCLLMCALPFCMKRGEADRSGPAK